MNLKIIRLTKLNRKKYQRSISILRTMGAIVTDSKPYVGMLDKETKKIVACIWIDPMNEMSIVTHENYRRFGLMTMLIDFMKNEVYLNRLDEINASPINSISKRIFKKAGFKRCEMPGYYEYSID